MSDRIIVFEARKCDSEWVSCDRLMSQPLIVPDGACVQQIQGLDLYSALPGNFERIDPPGRM
jgi:hypothetical protein